MTVSGLTRIELAWSLWLGSSGRLGPLASHVPRRSPRLHPEICNPSRPPPRSAPPFFLSDSHMGGSSAKTTRMLERAQ